MQDRDQEFVAFVSMRAPALRRTAFLLCGDWHRAEDVVQTALVKLYRRWNKVDFGDSPDRYARRVIVNTLIDESRRFWHRERATGAVPDLPVDPGVPDDAVDVRQAVASLPAGQRAAVVLRYWEDLPIAEVATLLGCSEGTVKSQSAKGLAALRRALASPNDAMEAHR